MKQRQDRRDVAGRWLVFAVLLSSRLNVNE